MTSPKRLQAALLMIAFCLGGYVAIQKILPLLSTQRAILTLPYEAAIPFWPPMILVYSMIYVLPLCMLVLLGKSRHFALILDSFTIIALIHFFIFLMLPVHYELRPMIQATTDPFLSAVSFTYTMDDTTNCFPSMHVSFAFLSYFSIRRFRPGWAKAFFVGAIAVSLSTILVKQHYVLDVVSAIGLAWLMDHIMALTNAKTRHQMRQNDSVV